MLALVQTLNRPVYGYWDGGQKQRFVWTIESLRVRAADGGYDTAYGDTPATHARIGAWEANHYFTVRVGRTDRLTLSYARAHLRAVSPCQSTFEIVDI